MLTDAEIIKALECCIKDNCDCSECPAIGVCQHDPDCPKTIALDLINRHKAEIERLKKLNDEGIQYDIELMKREKTDKTEAIKYFAERLLLEFPSGSFSYSHIRYKVNNLVKEMVGDE